MAYLNTKEFYLEVSKGNIPKHSRVNKTGFNSDIDAGTAEDIIDGGGTFVQPTAARIHALVSSDANDTAAGTGARTVTVQGLDTNYAFLSETVVLNGTTPVNTVGSYVMIDFMFIATAGSGGTNAGTITATAAVDATVTAQINIGDYNQAQMAVFQIRDGYKGYINQWQCAMFQNTASSSGTVHLMTKEFGGVWRTRRIALLNNSGNSRAVQTIHPPLQVSAKTLIKVRCVSVTNNNTSIDASFDLTLVQD